MVSASIYFGSLPLTALCLFAAFLHEWGHIAAAGMCGLSVRGLTLSAQGAQIALCQTPGSFIQEAMICCAGPAVNLLCAAVCLWIKKFPVFLASNLLLGLFNLLPVRPLDGGNALFALLSITTTWHRAERITRFLAFAAAVFTTALGTYLLCLEGGRPYLLLLGLWLLFGSIGK